MISLGFRYATREPVRFALTAGGLACAILLTLFLAGVYRGAVHGSLSYIAEAEPDIWVGRTGSWNLMRTSGLLSNRHCDSILAVSGVVSVEAILTALLPADVGDLRRTLLVIGLDENARSARPKHLVQGQASPGEGEIVIDRAFARRAQLELGDEFLLAGHTVRIAGITEATNLLVTQYAFVLRRELLSAVGLRDRATFFLVTVDGRPTREVLGDIEQRVANVSAYEHDIFLANNRREIESGFLPVLWAIAVLGLTVGGFIVSLTSYAAVLERRDDYVLLAAIGARPVTRLTVVMQQALTAAAVGSLAGLGGMLAVDRYVPLLVPELEFLMEPWMVAAALAGAAVMAVAGALLPGRTAIRFAPLEALRR